MIKKPIRHERLTAGLVLEFFDLSNRYFGDYHRVLIEVRCLIPLTAELFAAEADPLAALAEARKLLGDAVEFRRELTRMGVPGAEVAAVRDELIDSFLHHSLSYLQGADFADRFVRKALTEAGSKRRFTPRIL